MAGTPLVTGPSSVRAASVFHPLAEVFSAGTWNAVDVPLPADAATGSTLNASLTSVSCSTAVFCVASGVFETAAGSMQGLIETFADGAWTAAAATTPAGSAGQSYLSAVSCAARDTCAAVGWEQTVTGTAPLVDVLSSGGWAAVASPSATGAAAGTTASAYLDSVSCPAAGTCVAVGATRSATGATALFVDTVSDGVAHTEILAAPSAPPAGTEAGNRLSAVSCAATTHCVAVGTYMEPTGTTTALVATLSTGSWTTETAPAPSDVAVATAPLGTTLDAVDCPTTTSCVASGDYLDTTGGSPALIETLAAGAWSAAAAAAPSNSATGGTAIATLLAVSCASAGTCVAVAKYRTATGADAPLVEELHGGTWSASSGPVAQGASSGTTQLALLDTVSCAAGTCAAGGSYAASTGGVAAMVASGPTG